MPKKKKALSTLEEKTLPKEEIPVEEVSEEESLSVNEMLKEIKIVDVPEIPENFKLPDIVKQDLGLDITPEMQDLLHKVNTGSKGQVFQLRRAIRYRLFRLRDGGRIGEQHDKGLKAFMERQFEGEMNWSNFTFEWDVAPNNPLQIIPRDISNNAWREIGGTFDGADRRYPPAFTKQPQ